MKPFPLWWLFAIAAAVHAGAAGKSVALGAHWEAALHAVVTLWAAWVLTRPAETRR